MLVYRSSQKNLVEELQAKGWNNSTIQKYLDYQIKREHTIKRGRAAYKDSERSKLYKAERAWIKDLKKHGLSYKEFDSYEEANKRLKQITKSKLWKELTLNKGWKDVYLIPKKNISNAATAGVSWGHKIQLDRNCGLQEKTLIHELAHSSGNMHHGLGFRIDHVKLVSRFMGREHAKLLKKSYRTHGLRMNMKQKIKTPDEWLVGYNKMMEMRKKLKKSAENSCT
tara:strand:- start:667 stop:1341 length:675 start_codon:yes stop_codon:yes gene_type:complete